MTFSCFSTEIPATAEVARELCRLGDALYWRYKLVEILTKNYTTVAKVKWGAAGAEWRSSCVKFKSGLEDGKRRATGGKKMVDLVWETTLEMLEMDGRRRAGTFILGWMGRLARIHWSQSTKVTRESANQQHLMLWKHVDSPASRALREKISHPLVHKNGVCHR